MKIMVVGVFNENSTNNGISKGFVRATNEPVIEYNYRKRNKEIGSKARDEEIIEMCKIHRPDITFFCKCNGVHVSVVEECNKYSKTFIWYMDPLNGNYDGELKRKMQVATGVGIAKYEVYLLAKEHHNKNTHFLIEGFDPDWDYPMDEEKEHPISFIGALHGDRASWITSFKENIHIPANTYNTEHSKVVSRSKINLNLTGGGGPSDRAYKILAAKGFLLSQTYAHMDKYGLVPDKDFVTFTTKKEARDKATYYLNNEKEREEIAEHGYKTVQKFSRDNLAKEVIKILYE